jgi:hypothetical protein
MQHNSIKTVLRSCTLIALALSLCCIESTAQIQVGDSTHVVIDRMEFQHIILVNMQKRYLDSIVVELQQKIRLQDIMLSSKDSVAEHLWSSLISQQQLSDAAMPAWYDRFWVGSTVGAVLMGVFAILIKK